MTYLIVLAAVLARFVPYAPNFSPVYGALLFSGAYLKSRDSVWFPVALLAVTDPLISAWIYHMRWEWNQAFLWAAFAAVAVIGRQLRDRVSAIRVVGAALAGGTVFFLISNFAVWLGWKMYPATWPGLVTCYVAALPFFRSTLASTLVFSAVLFGGYEFYRRRRESFRLHSAVAGRG